MVAEGRAPPWQSFDAYAVTGYFSALLGGDEKRGAVMDWLARSRAEASGAAASLGLTGEAATAHVAAHAFDGAIALAASELADGSVTGDAADTLADLTGRVWQHHRAVAQARGLTLVMYEGGSHVVGYGMAVEDTDLTDFFTRLSYAPQMGDLYRTLLAGWEGVSDAPFLAFVDVATPGKWGRWGALRHLGDDNPRWRALATFCADAC